MRVRQILQLACVQSGLPSCVAGKDGLDRPVRWVHSGEVTEIADMLQGGELLLTTGVGLGATAAEQRRYAQALNRRGVAGVVLELGPRHPSAPAALREACEEAGMPLITLGRQVRFVSITEAAHREIVTDQLNVLERAEQEGRRFTDMVLSGATIEDLLADLAATVGNPAVLVRADGELAALARSRAPAREVLGAWRSGHEQWSTPVPAATGQWGELAVIALETAIDAFGRACARRAAGVIALALMRSHEDELLALREHGALLEAAAFGRLAIEELVLRADALEFAYEAAALLPFAIEAVPGTSGHAWSQLGRDLRHDLGERHLTVLMGAARSRRLLLGIAAVAPARGRERTAPQLAEAVAAAATRRLGSRASVRIALGGACEQWADAASGLRDAADVAAVALRTEWVPWVEASKPGLTVLLRRLHGSPEVEGFWRRQLEQLERHESGGGLALLAILRALCEHGWSKAAAARELGLERPSLYHHIARIERLVGESLDEPLVRTQLHVALLARDVAIPDRCRVNTGTNRA